MPLIFDSATRIESPGRAATPAVEVSPCPGTTMLSSDDSGIRNGVPSVGTPTSREERRGAAVHPQGEHRRLVGRAAVGSALARG